MSGFGISGLIILVVIVGVIAGIIMMNRKNKKSNCCRNKETAIGYMRSLFPHIN